MTAQRAKALGVLVALAFTSCSSTNPAAVQLCVDALLAMRRTAELQTTLLKARLLRLAASEPHRKIVAALCTHPGVGPLSAIRFVLEMAIGAASPPPIPLRTTSD